MQTHRTYIFKCNLVNNVAFNLLLADAANITMCSWTIPSAACINKTLSPDILEART